MKLGSGFSGRKLPSSPLDLAILLLDPLERISFAETAEHSGREGDTREPTRDRP